MLVVDNIETYYGNSQVLFGLSLKIDAGEVVTLIGRNGMGKTTTVGSIMGTVPARSGTITFRDQAIRERPPFAIARLGIGLVPEGRQIFPNLSVRENLVATAANHGSSKDPWDLDRVLGFFPALRERLDNMGNQLSGGEQQMLAIGRALMLNPDLLILDEATEGLAPLVRREIWQRLEQIRDTGLSILLIDKNLDALTRIADRHYIVQKGRIVWQGTSAELSARPELKLDYLGV